MMDEDELVYKLCRNRKCCPEVRRSPSGQFLIGEDDNVVTLKPHEFEDLVNAAKGGVFDVHITGG